jgi:uncharacterized protein (DUF1778 family)
MTNAKKSEEAKSAVEQDQRELLDAAASLCDPTRSAFILDEATSAASEALLERRVFFSTRNNGTLLTPHLMLLLYQTKS